MSIAVGVAVLLVLAIVVAVSVTIAARNVSRTNRIDLDSIKSNNIE